MESEDAVRELANAEVQAAPKKVRSHSSPAARVGARLLPHRAVSFFFGAQLSLTPRNLAQLSLSFCYFLLRGLPGSVVVDALPGGESRDGKGGESWHRVWPSLKAAGCAVEGD